MGDMAKVKHPRTSSTRCVKHRWGRIGQWNLGGQKVDLLDLAANDLDIVFVQEIARDEVGWNTENTELFHWISYRSPSLWRGVGVGISKDRLDCVIQKIECKRGVWILARIKGLGRVVLGTMHCHTGATNAIFQGAAIQFAKACPRKWLQYPLICGIDANEEARWFRGEGMNACLCEGSNNLNVLVDQLSQMHCKVVAPREDQWHKPSHYPRDVNRTGRQIDVIWKRRLDSSEVSIDSERRHVPHHGPLHGEQDREQMGQ